MYMAVDMTLTEINPAQMLIQKLIMTKRAFLNGGLFFRVLLFF